MNELLTPTANPLSAIVLLVVLSLLPFVFMMTTSFVKMVVVFSLFRTAIGTPQIPPSTVITGLALVLTLYVMAPTGSEIYRQLGKSSGGSPEKALLNAKSPEVLISTINAAREPLRKFLRRNGSAQERHFFLNLAKKRGLKETREQDFFVLVPAFVIDQLSTAFKMGFLIFLPFLVVDMVVANILLALGMHMLSPTTVSLPFKLLLFVMVNGWQLITEGLVTSYI